MRTGRLILITVSFVSVCSSRELFQKSPVDSSLNRTETAPFSTIREQSLARLSGVLFHDLSQVCMGSTRIEFVLVSAPLESQTLQATPNAAEAYDSAGATTGIKW